jgi:hypothetical protein
VEIVQTRQRTRIQGCEDGKRPHDGFDSSGGVIWHCYDFP